jgi:predicted nucleic acid-binding protein
MKTSGAFWDTSALVPLLVRQETSVKFRTLWRESGRVVVVWWGASVEMRSALSRLRQRKHISAPELERALTRLDAMRGQWREILASEKLKSVAETLPDSYGLRTLDALQLGAALVWCHEKPKGRVFLCDDVKLCDAAQKAGFTVKPGK